MMDFLRPEFEGYFKSKKALCAEHGLDAERPLLLYISSFGYASMTEQEVRELSEMAGEDFTGFAHTNRVSMEQTLAWFDRYLTEHPETQLVYRRHPSEWNSPALLALAEKHANFHVIFSEQRQTVDCCRRPHFYLDEHSDCRSIFCRKSCGVLRLPFPLSMNLTRLFIEMPRD